MTWARILFLARSKLRLCSANHRAGYFSNLSCDWLRTVWAYSEQETENGPRWILRRRIRYMVLITVPCTWYQPKAAAWFSLSPASCWDKWYVDAKRESVGLGIDITRLSIRLHIIEWLNWKCVWTELRYEYSLTVGGIVWCYSYSLLAKQLYYYRYVYHRHRSKIGLRNYKCRKVYLIPSWNPSHHIWYIYLCIYICVLCVCVVGIIPRSDIIGRTTMPLPWHYSKLTQAYMMPSFWHDGRDIITLFLDFWKQRSHCFIFVHSQ